MKITSSEKVILLFIIIKEFLFEFCQYIFLKIANNIKLLLLYSFTIFIGFVYYCNSVYQFTRHTLFAIDYSFFSMTKEMEYWYALFTIMDVLSHLDWVTFLKLLSLFILCAIPFFVADKSIKEGDRISAYILYFFSSWLSLLIMFFFFLITELFISQAQDKYISENPKYCRIVLNKSSDELVLVENPSVPYKLIFKKIVSESLGIYYFKPNEPIALWQTIESEDLKRMKAICKKAQSKQRTSNASKK